MRMHLRRAQICSGVVVQSQEYDLGLVQYALAVVKEATYEISSAMGGGVRTDLKMPGETVEFFMHQVFRDLLFVAAEAFVIGMVT